MRSHPAFEGIAEKLRRADELTRRLAQEHTAFLASKTYEIVARPSLDGTEYVFEVVGPPVPLRFGVLVGEIAHHLRSCLDYLIWQLVLANRSTPGRQHAFPICETSKGFLNAVEIGRIDGVSARAKSIIESVQPFQEQHPKQHALSVLAEIDNIDKHRLVLLTIATMKVRQVVLDHSDTDVTIVGMRPPTWPPSAGQQGNELQRVQFDRPSPGVRMSAHGSAFISLGDIGPLGSQPIVQTAEKLREMVTVIFDRFDCEFK